MSDDRRDDDPGDTPDGEAHRSEILDLLELGYEQLDAFVAWDEEAMQVGARIAQQDCFNAELLIDYLANHHQKGISGINEFDLRWFILSHYIRKAQADPETEERLPESLTRFFQFLRMQHSELVPSWLSSVLEDDAFYQHRRLAYHELDQMDEHAWDQEFHEWCRELEDDLDLRGLWLPRDLGDHLQWSPTMGWRESTLQGEANRDWQRERERLVHSGVDFDTIRERLTVEFQLWVDTPQARLDGMTPREVIVAERADRITDDEELT